MKWRRIGAELLVLAAVIQFAQLISHRATLVTRSYGSYTGCGDCFELSVWSSDGYLVAGLLALVALSRLVRGHLTRGAVAAFAIGTVFVFCLDVLLFELLTHRLVVSDALRYGADLGTLSSVASPLLAQRSGQLVLLGCSVLGAATVLAILTGPVSRSMAAVWLASCSVVVAACHSAPKAEYLHQVAFKNVVEVNLLVDSSRPYSREAMRKVREEAPPGRHCEPGWNTPASFILLVVESWSPYHSKLFSGLRDLTPKLDDLAAQNTHFTRFVANGYSTEGGLIALLTGHVPMPTAGRFGSVMVFTEVEGDFHRWLDQRGYQTAFFTSGLLSYGDRARWLKAIGIAHAEGGEHPFYDGMARGAFGAASDRALFDRFLQWHDAERTRNRFFATILTVETHPPYFNAAGEGDEAARFMKADAEIGRFVSGLRARGFFAEGVLMIMGDHRAMTPISKEEQDLLGTLAPMLVPAIVIGSSGLPRGRAGENVQQVDLIPSVRRMIGDQDCRTEWQGAFLGGGVRSPRYIAYADPIKRNELGVVVGEARHGVRLDGDDTRWVGAAPDGGDRLLGYINGERIRRMAEFREIQ